MKKLLGGVCLIVFAMFAVEPASADDFKGFSRGGNGWGASGNSNAFTSTVFSPTAYFATTSVPAIAGVGAQNPSGNGFTGGGQVGFNIQHNSIVLGLETDFGGFNLNNSKVGTAT